MVWVPAYVVVPDTFAASMPLLGLCRFVRFVYTRIVYGTFASLEREIETVENKPLARMLYHNVDGGAEIPPELYQAVAEVLAAVYKAKNIQ